MKNIFLIMMLFLMTQVALGSGEIRLQKATSTLRYIYHGLSWQEVHVLIVAKNINNLEKVYVHDKSGNYEAKYVKKINSNYSLWQVSKRFEVYSGVYKKDLNFSLSMVTSDGTHFTDNNEGDYYVLGANEGTILGERVNASVRYIYAKNNKISRSFSYSGKVDIRNIAYAKDVKVVYTLDNWKTTKEKNVRYGLDENAHGMREVELWFFRIDKEELYKADALEFSISYTVDGKTYWANNFGSNYKFNFN